MASVSEKVLLKLRDEGWHSELLDLRLAFAESDSLLRYLRPLRGQDRVHPHFLPTQRSGRWSTKDPPLPNFSALCIAPNHAYRGEHIAVSSGCWSLRDIVRADPGTYFLKFDWDAIEAKLAAAYSGDTDDLEAFARGDDIHTITYCRMYGIPLPPDLQDPHKAESCADWRETLKWGGKDDWRRVASKTSRYSLAYGTDKRAILQAKDANKLGSRDELLALAEAYLASKPNLVNFKYRTWATIMEAHESRTFLGRRRRLFVTSEEYRLWKRTRKATASCREGLNHMFQGAVADMMNLTIIAVKRRWPQARLGYQSHDGAVFVVPETLDIWPGIREVVERVWNVDGYELRSTATWARVNADGTKGNV